MPMWEDLDIALEKADPKEMKDKPAPDNLGFGAHFTDHMFFMRWTQKDGWHGAKICPYQPFSLDPSTVVFHYGQAIFEGLKAFKGDDGQLYLFRPLDNFERMNTSALRMCMPRIPVAKVLKALKSLVYLEREWVPAQAGSSLYIRPTMIGVQPVLGVKPSNEYYFFIILSPVAAYYAEGFNPTRIYVEDHYSRSVKGGVGNVKTSGNYAASLYVSERAKKEGCAQVLWLDACEHRYVEEVGTSNIFFRIGDRLITPPLEGSILGGITRDSVITLAQRWGIEVAEERISIDDVLEARQNNTLKEVFGTGTAAVISPVGELFYQGETHVIHDGKTGELSARLFDELQGIQYGRKEDPFQWVVRIG